MNLEQLEVHCAEFILQQQIHDAAHDINHIKRVVATAKKLCVTEHADLNIVLPAAWLHDCVSFPKNHPDNKRASVLAGDKAVEFKEGGKLSDLAPTMLALTDTAIPTEMSGEILVK